MPPIKDETEFQGHSAWVPLPPPLTRDELAAKIAEIIAVVIDSYRNSPAGNSAPVSSIGTMIIVYAPRSVHQVVETFLQRFRESVPDRPDQ